MADGLFGMQFVKVLKKSIKIVFVSTYPTSNLYFHKFWSVKQVLEEKVFGTNTNIVAKVLEMKSFILDKTCTILDA